MVFVKQLYKTGRGQIFQDMDDVEEAAASGARAAPSHSTMEEYLKSWDLSILYIDKFKEHSIDFETLQILSADDIKELIPVIGHRAKLITQISLLKDIITDAFSPSKTTDGVEDVLKMDDVYLIDGSTYTLAEQPEEPPSEAEPQREQRKRCKLYETLVKYNDGRGLLLRYEDKGLLDNAARRRLCSIIINDELNDDPEKTITSSRLYQLAFEITEIFKKECSAVYFIPFASYGPRQRMSAKGKLLDCYRQRRREFIKSGIIKRREKRCDSAHSDPESPRPSTNTQAAVMQLQDHLESDTEEMRS